MTRLRDISTPALLLNLERFEHNLVRMRQHLAGLGVPLRPHLKSAKSIEVATRVMAGGEQRAMVSTLREAEFYARRGVLDIIYGVGITPSKLPRVGALRRETGADVAVILDSLEQAQAVASWSRANNDALPVLIEIDVDGHRSGVALTNAAELISIGQTLVDDGATLRGVLTHAGASYALNRPEELVTAARVERETAINGAEMLRTAGLPCAVVSMGSTPTAMFATDLAGISEVRAGVYMFGDLVQAGIGTCSVDDIALSVLASVIGTRPEKGWIIVDAGWMALSRDRGVGGQGSDHGYGLVCDERCLPYPDLIVLEVNQEHGIIGLRPGSTGNVPKLPIGSLVRILPNHACATGGQHDRYQVVSGDVVVAEWQRVNGWQQEGDARDVPVLDPGGLADSNGWRLCQHEVIYLG